ncbi:MAG: response regulator [Desulfamplus sp.]|nr:response regulator [Desulfamplus sp.]
MGDNTKKDTILIVDDSPENISLISSLLKGIYKIKVAINGKKALQIASSNDPPDLILLDIMMPEMDGYETCRHLKSDLKTAAIPVIFLTSKDQTEDEQMGLELGAVDYITKPVSPPIVCARVKNHLELSRAYKHLKAQAECLKDQAECLKEQAECLKDQTEQLEIQNKELIETNRLREDIERITRHDLKSPLNGIINFPELIRLEGGLNEKQTKYLQRIVEGGYKMLSMINLSLDIFKMERGIYPFKPESVNILTVIDNITRELQNYIQLKNISISIILNDTLINKNELSNRSIAFFVQGEELLCYSMLSNLLKNAVEASPQSGTINISLTDTITHSIENYNVFQKDLKMCKKKAVIRIHNQGAVPHDIRDRFFNKYITSGKQKGTGLGTYSAKLIAHTQKGEITMETSEEGGTSIIICLNRA